MRALLSTLTLALALAPACKDEIIPIPDASSSAAGSDDAGLGLGDQAIADWPDASKAAAEVLIKEYGQPDDSGNGMIFWGPRGPWKRMTAYRDPVAHDFPSPHSDVIEQVVDARVAPSHASDLAAFDGSVHVDRTAGEISAREDAEATNFAALNFAMEIASGAKTVADARQAMADAVAANARGQGPAETQKLTFPAAQGTADPDVAVAAR